MKKFFLYFLLIFFSLVLQTGFVPSFFIIKVLPDISLMLVLAWTIIDGFSSFLPWLILAGLIYDFISFSPMGTHVLIFSTVSYMASFISKRFNVESNPLGMFLVALFVLLSTLISRAISVFLAYGLQGFSYEFSDFDQVFYGLAMAFLINMGFFVICYYSIKKSKKFFYLK